RVVVSQQIAAPAGGAADVAVQLYRGTDPQPGVGLLLRGASAIPGGATQDPVAITDWRGIATFRVLAGTTPGTYRLTVAMPNGPSLGPTTRIDFITTPIIVAPPPPPPKPVVSDGLTRFTQGTELHGTAGAARHGRVAGVGARRPRQPHRAPGLHGHDDGPRHRAAIHDDGRLRRGRDARAPPQRHRRAGADGLGGADAGERARGADRSAGG